MKDLEVTLTSFDEYVKNRCLSGMADTCAYFITINSKALLEAREELTAAHSRSIDIGDTSNHPSETTQVNLDSYTMACQRAQDRLDEWQFALDSLAKIGIETTKKPTTVSKPKPKAEDFLIK